MCISLCVHAMLSAKSLQSCPTLCDPIDGSPPGSPVPGILQAGPLEWVAISFSNAWKRKVKMKSLSRVRLFATPWTAAHQAPPSMGFSRQEYWSGVSTASDSITSIWRLAGGPLSAPFWCLCQKLSLSPLYLNKTLLHKSSEWSSLVSGPWLNSPPGAKNPGVFSFNNLSDPYSFHFLLQRPGVVSAANSAQKWLLTDQTMEVNKRNGPKNIISVPLLMRL